MDINGKTDVGKTTAMKVLILHAVSAADTSPSGAGMLSTIEKEYLKAGWDVQTLAVSEMDISSCRGCFHCWVRTPGICVIDDAGRAVAKAWMQSDLVVLVTPVTFGGYCAALKKAVDRIIPILSPFFMKIRGEVHHKQRYEKYPALVGIGVLPRRDEESAALFSRIIERHATNAHSPWHRAFVLSGDRECRGVGDIIGPIAARKKEAA
jgi:multimeric flavodoxin WrbA